MIEQLEAALADDFSLENLQVYGDALQATGDPRGHLIAIDLHIARHGPSKELAYRRRQRLREWLELSHAVDPTKGPWESVTFAFGFVEDLRADRAIQVLKSPAGRYVRGLTLAYRIPHMVAVLHELGSAPRPWLDRLTIVSKVRGAPPLQVWGAHAAMMEQGWIPSVIAATPRLRRFELAGNRMIRAFPHPHVSQLQVDGIDALQAILQPGPAMTGVTELALTFAHALDAPVLMEPPWPELVPAESFPALTRLDLSTNWIPPTTDTQVGVFDVLPTLGVREQLEELRLWGLYGATDAVLMRALRMPDLRRLELEHLPKFSFDLPGVEIANVRPHWPRDPGALTAVAMEIAGGYGSRLLPLRGFALYCHHARSRISAAAYEAWDTVWQTIEALPYGSLGGTLSSTTLRVALDGLGYLDASHRDIAPWVRLRDLLQILREEHEVSVTMAEA